MKSAGELFIIFIRPDDFALAVSTVMAYTTLIILYHWEYNQFNPLKSASRNTNEIQSCSS
jgi:hypothetical protein